MTNTSRTKTLIELVAREGLREITLEQAKSRTYVGSVAVKVIFENEHRMYCQTPYRNIVGIDKVRRNMGNVLKAHKEKKDLEFVAYLSSPFSHNYDPEGGIRGGGGTAPGCDYNTYAFVINLFQRGKIK